MLKKFRIKLNDKEYIVEMEDLNPEVQFQSSTHQSSNISESTSDQHEQKAAVPATPESREGEQITAPMPGTILDIILKEGDSVREDDPVLVLEAMKMENKIVAPKDGVVTSILVQKGQTVDVGSVLFTVA